MTAGPPLAIVITIRLPRSRKKRIIKKWLRDELNWTTTTRAVSAEEEREHEEWHRLHDQAAEVRP